MAVTKPWADGPFQLIPATNAGTKAGQRATGACLMAEEMIIIHNILLRGINAVYLQCENVAKRGTPRDVDDFVNYAIQWYRTVERHHQEEETHVFPEIEKIVGAPGIMTPNVEQHEAFHPGLEEYKMYLGRVQGGEETFDGLKLRKIIDSFMPILRQHLHDEINTLVALAKYDDKVDWATWWAKIMKEIMAQTKDDDIKKTAFPMAMTAHDKTFDKGASAAWPPIPWFLNLIFQWFFIPTHKNWWRFAASTSYSRPRELPFA